MGSRVQTYGSLGTGVGVSDSNPFSTVGTASVCSSLESTDVVIVTARQHMHRRNEAGAGEGREK